ncbi:Gibberellin 3-beta-dioxygenase 1 [Cardamine amara subsp. amara]|uniref:gibberellin 3beta-dioxygenase n=1 Tax=Cardamine amara subsp. amara TaxID=228776 RepID=A0ABD1BMM3_CARAN
MPTTLTDVFRGHPIHLPHSHQPDFTALRELPDSYTWTPKDDILFAAAPSPPPATGETIPLIDLNHPDAANQIGLACKTWGAFQIANHGVPLELLQDIEFLTSSLFRLPVQRKLKAARSETGVTGYGVARIASFFNKQMWSEGFTISGSPLNDFRKLWPQLHLNYCDIVEEYEEQMRKLASKLMWLALNSIGVSEEDVKWARLNSDFNWAQAALQLNHYPVCPQPDQAMGLAAHTDSTLLTLLYQNNTAGLQVFRDDLGWVTVPPVPGSLVVNVGDLFHILSNGLFKSVLHRARVNQTRSRFSVAFLWGPQSDIRISSVPKLVSPVESPLYQSVTWAEYLKIKATHFNKALSMIRNH